MLLMLLLQLRVDAHHFEVVWGCDYQKVCRLDVDGWGT